MRTTCLAALAVLALLPPSGADAASAESTDRSLSDFTARHAGTRLFFRDGGHVGRVFGPAFGGGASPLAAADTFRRQSAAAFGAEPDDLVPGARHLPAGQASVPAMYDPATGVPRFHVVYHTQQRGGVPVFGARLTLLVRNEANFPLVLANPDVRELGDFQPDPALVARGITEAGRTAALGQVGDGGRIVSTETVIWAGTSENHRAPILAHVSDVRRGADAWRVITDAVTGAIVHAEHRVYFVDGSVSGLVTEGIGAEQCEEEVPTALPYVKVVAGATEVFTDADGSFTFAGGAPVIQASLDGQWFDVFDFFNNEVILQTSGLGPFNFVFNGANDEEEVRSQVNTYFEANRIRDLVVALNPTYPTINNTDFPATANRTDQFCPGNAWYSPGEQSINFCLSGGGHPNTSWSSVVHHEYGHHLVEAGGSGQGQYGEGMGDVMSLLLADDPQLGLGFFGPCDEPLRNADNSMQYPCSGAIHFCGQLISGAVWDTRNALIVTEPDDYITILGNLAVNSILLHSGESIDPSITIDYLTLDDDNGDILDGTPHYTEISTGFGLHNLDAPELAAIGFSFPDGLPDLVDPAGGDVVAVQVNGINSSPAGGTGMIHLSTTGLPGSFSAFPMTEVMPNVYEGTFPAGDCGEALHYYFSAESTGGATQTWPSSAPDDHLLVVSALGVSDTFEDDAETDPGWTVSSTASDGQWERGVPAGGGDRGDPPVDGDGSGQAWVTDNADGNSDVDEGSTVLESPDLDVSSGENWISYWRWYSNTSGSNPFQDTFLIEISNNGGGSWSTLETVGPNTVEADGGWYESQFRVSDVIAPTSQVRLRFTASDTDPQSVVEAAVDGLRVRTYTCDDVGGGCAGDLDGSGSVDVSDLVEMVLAWGTSGPADIDGSGTVDVGDLVELVLGWGPCPTP